MSSVGAKLSGIKVQDPLFDKKLPIIFDMQIRSIYGSGINTVSPPHFIDDMKLAMDFNLKRECYVNESGKYDEKLP